MKTEIQQVLKMNKEGILTDDQAAELLAELAKRECPESGGGRAGGTGSAPAWSNPYSPR